MALLKQDKLNNLSKPYEEYFGEMGLSEEDIKRRIDLAESLDDIFFLLFSLIRADLYLSKAIDIDYYVDYILQKYENVLSEAGIDTETAYPALVSHIIDTAKEVVAQNAKHSDDPWQTSDERAMLIAENESNNVYEYVAFQDAVSSGKTRKVWNTMFDNKVRHTHIDLEGVSIPIMERFKVGAYEMYQPKDTTLGAGMEEVANCRCWCSYL